VASATVRTVVRVPAVRPAPAVTPSAPARPATAVRVPVVPVRLPRALVVRVPAR